MTRPVRWSLIPPVGESNFSKYLHSVPGYGPIVDA
jgi:hypothetical protein